MGFSEVVSTSGFSLFVLQQRLQKAAVHGLKCSPLCIDQKQQLLNKFRGVVHRAVTDESTMGLCAALVHV